LAYRKVDSVQLYERREEQHEAHTYMNTKKNLHIVETETKDELDEFLALPLTLLELLHFNMGKKETHFLIRSPSVVMCA
jgi:hypothetical protein